MHSLCRRVSRTIYIYGKNCLMGPDMPMVPRQLVQACWLSSTGNVHIIIIQFVIWYPLLMHIYACAMVHQNAVHVCALHLAECPPANTKMYIYTQFRSQCFVSVAIACIYMYITCRCFEVYPDPVMQEVTHFCLPGLLPILTNTVQFVHEVLYT